MLSELLHNMVQNVHQWLTCMPTVTCGSVSQCCQWLSTVRQTKSTEVHL